MVSLSPPCGLRVLSTPIKLLQVLCTVGRRVAVVSFEIPAYECGSYVACRSANTVFYCILKPAASVTSVPRC